MTEPSPLAAIIPAAISPSCQCEAKTHKIHCHFVEEWYATCEKCCVRAAIVHAVCVCAQFTGTKTIRISSRDIERRILVRRTGAKTADSVTLQVARGLHAAPANITTRLSMCASTTCDCYSAVWAGLDARDELRSHPVAIAGGCAWARHDHSSGTAAPFHVISTH